MTSTGCSDSDGRKRHTKHRSETTTASRNCTISLKTHYLNAAREYQQTCSKFILGKTGINPGGGMVFRMKTDTNEKPKAIDPQELPPFDYHAPLLADVVPPALVDVALLAMFCFVFFAVAHVAF